MGDGEHPRRAHRARPASTPPIRRSARRSRSPAQLLGFPRHLSQHVGGFVLTRERLDETGADRQRRHGGPHRHRVGQGRHRRARHPQGRRAGARHADLHPQGLRPDRAPLRPRRSRSPPCRAEDRGRLRHALHGRLARRVPGREPGADVDAAAAEAAHASTTSSSRWRSCAPGRSRATWCIPTCAGATGVEPVRLSLRTSWRRCSARRSACRCSRSRRCRSPSSRAGFTPDEADQLRRAMATFRHVGTIHTFREKFIAGMVAQRLRARVRRALLQPDRGLRRLRLPREPRGQLRAARLCLGLDEVPLPGRVLRRAPQQPADGLLRRRPSSCATPASTASRCATSDVNAQRLGLHAGAARRSPRIAEIVALRRPVGEGQGGGGSRTSALVVPLTPNPSPQGGRGIRQRRDRAPSASGCASSAGWRRRRPRRRS